MNRPDKPTRVIAYPHALNIIHAADHSIWIGRRLNRFTTIRLHSVSDRYQQFRQRYLHSVSDWLSEKPRNIPPTYVWAFEKPPGRRVHLHLAFHLPVELVDEFTYHQRAWVTSAGVKWGEDGLILSKWVQPSKLIRSVFPGLQPWELPLHVQSGALRNLIIDYFLKGGDARTCREFEIDYRTQGTIMGKRVGFSENLGPTARARIKTVHEFRVRDRIVRRRRPHLLLDYPALTDDYVDEVIE